MKTKIFVVIIVILAGILIGANYSKHIVLNDNKIIKIGVIAPLTGNVAFLGDGIKYAVRMAEAELASTTNNKWQYKVILENDSFDASRAVSAAQKLISIDHVAAIVTLASAAGNAVNPVAEKARVIQFGIASDPNVANGHYNFIHWTPPYEETKIFVPELQKRGYHRVAILGAKIQGVTAVIHSLQKDIQNTDIQIVDQEMFDFGTKDFRTMIAKAQSNHPDIYVLFAFSPELDLIAKQLKENGITTPVTSIESFEQSDHPEIYEGDWYVNGADTTLSFIDSYSKIYNKPPSLGAGNAYDIIHLISDAAEKVDSNTLPTSEQIAEKLYTIKNVQGALGNLSIDSDGLVVSGAVIRMIKDGKPITIQP